MTFSSSRHSSHLPCATQSSSSHIPHHLHSARAPPSTSAETALQLASPPSSSSHHQYASAIQYSSYLRNLHSTTSLGSAWATGKKRHISRNPDRQHLLLSFLDTLHGSQYSHRHTHTLLHSKKHHENLIPSEKRPQTAHHLPQSSPRLPSTHSPHASSF